MRLGAEGGEVLANVDPSVTQFAEYVWTRVPGAPVLAIDLVLEHSYEVPLQKQAHAVVEVSERPWLYVQDRYSRASALDLGLEILRSNLAQIDHAFSRTHADVAVDVRWEGVSDVHNLSRYLEEAFVSCQVECNFTAVNDLDGTIIASVRGPHYAVALVNELALAREFGDEHVMLIEATPALE